MKRASTPSFIATFGLRYEPWQRDKLDKLFQVDNNIYNSLVKDRKKALGQLERTRAWRRNKAGIASIFAVMDKENPSKEHQEALKVLYAEKQDMLSQYGLGEYAFQAKAQKYRKHYKKLVNTHIAQTTATAVWHKFEDYLLIYTGFSRAKKLLVVVGSEKALQYAVSHEVTTKRNTMLKERLRAEILGEPDPSAPAVEVQETVPGWTPALEGGVGA